MYGLTEVAMGHAKYFAELLWVGGVIVHITDLKGGKGRVLLWARTKLSIWNRFGRTSFQQLSPQIVIFPFSFLVSFQISSFIFLSWWLSKLSTSIFLSWVLS